jgi:hypothetical protein
MNHLMRVLIVLGAAQMGVVSSSNAQTLVANGAGSSALYLEAGQAAQTVSNGVDGALTCLWTAKSDPAKSLVATDTTTGVTENGQSWIAWNTSTNCATPDANTVVYAYEQTDSVVGNRLLFNPSTTTLTTPTASAGLIYPVTAAGGVGNEVSALPAGIAGLFAAAPINFAGTDIRPEDAEFATVRALTTGGASVGGSQYIGLGYASPSSISSAFSGSVFHVASFNLPSSFQVFKFGAVPILVTVNTASAAGTGFANTAIQNIDSQTLASIFDGSLSRTEDVSGITTNSEGITVVEREPVSGTYNTFEFNIPNTVDNQTSQDVGLLQPAAYQALSGGVPINPLNISTKDGSKLRAIGTGEELNAIFGGGSLTSYPPAGASIIGYAFWSTQNFKGAYSGGHSLNTNARYLLVDDIDPLFNQGSGSYSYTGIIPTPVGSPAPGGAGFANVTLTNVANGTYPIWSFLRLVTSGAANTAAAQAASALATAAQSFVSFGGAASQADFIPAANATVLRSHFIPPTLTLTSVLSNGTTVTNSGTIHGINEPESGGDVGGEVLTVVSDQDYIKDYQASSATSKHVGHTGLRR